MKNPLKTVTRAARLQVRRTLEDFWAAVDDEKIGTLQVIFYVIMVANCLYNLLGTDIPIQVIESNLNEPTYAGWLLSGVIGPAIVFGSKLVDWYGPFGLGAMWAQLTGDLMVLATLSTYLVATVSEYWGKGNFGGSLALTCSLAVTLFVVRDLRRIAQRDQWVEWPT